MTAWWPSNCHPHGSLTDGCPMTVMWYCHSPYSSKFLPVSSPGVLLGRKYCARELQTSGAERPLKKSEGLLPLVGRHLEKADTLPHVEALVHPLAPLDVVCGKHRLRALVRLESGQES